jgi:hypothetical protein
LELVEHPESGLQIRVIAVNEQSKKKAEEIMAGYPFAFTVTLEDGTAGEQSRDEDSLRGPTIAR